MKLTTCPNCGFRTHVPLWPWHCRCGAVHYSGKWGLGDWLAYLFRRIGITSQRIEKLTGRKCGCKQRQQWLNRVTAKIWPRRSR